VSMPRVFAAACILILALMGVEACGGSSESSRQVASRGEGFEILKWAVLSEPGPKQVRVGGEVAYCVGDPRPKIVRPDMSYNGGDLNIKLEVRMFPHREEVCAGKELLLSRAISLSRELSELKLYDSGFEPPRQVWPGK